MNRRKDVCKQRRGTGRVRDRALITVPDQWDSLSYLVLLVSFSSAGTQMLGKRQSNEN